MKKFVIGSIFAAVLGTFSSCNECYTCQQSEVLDGAERGTHRVLEIREVCSRSERRKLEKNSQDNENSNTFWTCDKNKDLEESAEDIERINGGGE